MNEAQAENLTGPLDNFGQLDPWVELYNPGSNALNLAGFYLSDAYTHLTRWAFPSNAVVPAGGFALVWCDNQTNQATVTNFHTNFRLAPGAGGVALSRIISNSLQVVDYLTYSDLRPNWSYGDVPDAQPFYRRSMFYPTPNAPNNGAAPPISVFINEWMADNTSTLTDPADGKFEDWFEIFNPGTNSVDLGGFYLTDTLANKTKFLIPNNGQYVVPAGGFLLVWADDGAAQNVATNADLHANFALSKSGEAIGLFAADGTQIDAITFGPQTSDVSEGRFADGAIAIYSMPIPTPRLANVIPNRPPVLAAIGNRTLVLGQTLSFVVAATDLDQPPQDLSFTLASGAPAGATLNLSSGQFTWTPSSAPSTNQITVIVTDDGTPSQSAQRTFTVWVYPPSGVAAEMSSGQIQISWSQGTLQHADAVEGPYVDVSTASPYGVAPSDVKKFFRVRQGP